MDQQPYQPPADSIMAILCYLIIKILFFATLDFVTFKNNTFLNQENK